MYFEPDSVILVKTKDGNMHDFSKKMSESIIRRYTTKIKDEVFNKEKYYNYPGLLYDVENDIAGDLVSGQFNYYGTEDIDGSCKVGIVFRTQTGFEILKKIFNKKFFGLKYDNIEEIQMYSHDHGVW